MNGTIGTLQAAATLATLAQTASQANWFRRFISPPLAAQTIASQTLTLAVAGTTTNATNSPWNPNITLYTWRPSTGVRVTLMADQFHPSFSSAVNSTSEIGEVGTVSSVNYSSSTIVDGDVLVLEIWGQDIQGMATSYTWTFNYDGTTEPANTVAVTSAASYFDAGVDLPLFVASSFVPAFTKPILQAVNRSNTY